MDTITFGKLRRYLIEKEDSFTATEVHNKIVIFGNTYDMFTKMVDNHIGKACILRIKIEIFEIVFVDDGKWDYVNITSCDGKVVISDSFFNLERIPIKKYIGISPVKSARN
jgi:hypothetical protein